MPIIRSSCLWATIVGVAIGLTIVPHEPAHALTKVCGDINENATWTVAEHPIVVTCPTTLTVGATLTVEPGVQVRFKKSSRKGKPGLVVEGQLIAKGMEEKPIIFTSDARKPFQGDWSSLRFSKTNIGTQLDANGNYVGGSIIEFAVIEMGGGGGKIGVVEVHETALLLSNVVIHKNAASAVRVKNGTVTIRDSLLQSNSNSQAFGSGVLAHSSTLTLERTDVIKNHVAGQGAGVFAHDSTVSVSDTRFIENRSDANGAGLFVTDSTLTVTNVEFDKNVTVGRGGALYAARSTVTVENSWFTENATQFLSFGHGEVQGRGPVKVRGGAAYFRDADVTISGTTFANNKADMECGALGSEGSKLVIYNSAFLHNWSKESGSAMCIDASKPGSLVSKTWIEGNDSTHSDYPSTVFFQNGPLLQISNNNFFVEETQVAFRNLTHLKLKAHQNWWGTTDEDTLRTNVIGGSRNVPSAENITFVPIKQSPVDIPELTLPARKG